MRRLPALLFALACAPPLPDTDDVVDPPEGDTPVLEPWSGTPDLWTPPAREADTDTDDTDIDTDVDTGIHLDTTRDVYGVLTWQQWQDGVQTCDATLVLHGTAASKCLLCEYTYEVDVSFAARTGSSCTLNREELFARGFLGQARRWDDPWREERFRDVLLAGDGDEVWVPIERRNDPRGSAVLDGSALTWAGDRVTPRLVDVPDAYDDCGTKPAKRAAARPTASWTAEDTIPCDGTAVDAWTVTLDAPTTVLVDSIDPARPFDPYLWVNDPDACTIYESDDAVVCTAEPPSYGCPSLTLPAGTWTVYLGSRGQCLDGATPYRVVLDGTADPRPVLAHDDEPTGRVSVNRIRTTGALTLQR